MPCLRQGVDPVLRTYNTLIIACNMCCQPRAVRRACVTLDRQFCALIKVSCALAELLRILCRETQHVRTALLCVTTSSVRPLFGQGYLGCRRNRVYVFLVPDTQYAQRALCCVK